MNLSWLLLMMNTSWLARLHHSLLLCDVMWNKSSSWSGIVSNSTTSTIASHSTTGFSPRSHYLHFMSRRNFTSNVSSRRRWRCTCCHILGHTMRHKAMYVHVSCKVANVNISRNWLGNDWHRIHRIAGRTPGHVML